MSINSVSSLNYYSQSSILRSSASSTTEETSEEFQLQQGPPPGPPPNDVNIDIDEDSTWSTEELTNYAEYAQSEFGIDLNVEELMTTYDSDEDGSLTSTEIEALMKDNGLQLPPPPEQSDVDEQKDIMAQMQSATSVSATTLNIEEYLFETTDEKSSNSVIDVNLAEQLQQNLFDTYMYNDSLDEVTQYFG